MRRTIVAVIGGSEASPAEIEAAAEVGRLVAKKGWALATGGLTGVMEAASRGASEAGGLVIGIVPQKEPSAANRYVELAIATGMGHARNAIIVNTAAALIAVGGKYGTLSEVALALADGKPVFGIGSWEIEGVVRVAGAREAVEALSRIRDLGPGTRDPELQHP
jgi:uncharacterized protein (TIGR00725 family)